jgi:hypothetical protein
VLKAYATATDTQPSTVTAGPDDSDDDVVITNGANSLVTLTAGVLTLKAHVSNQATLQVKGAGTIKVGGSTNSVTFTKALFTAASHGSSGDTTFTGAGGIVDIAVAQGVANGGKLALADGGTIVTKGIGHVLVSTGLKIGGAATTVTSIDDDASAEKLSIFAATNTTATLTINKEGSGDVGDGIKIGTDSTAANNLFLVTSTNAATTYTFTKEAGSGNNPVEIAGTSVIVPKASSGTTGAIFGISATAEIKLGEGSIKLERVATATTAGNGKFVAASGAKLGTFTATQGGSNYNFPAGLVNATDSGSSSGTVVVASNNTGGVLTLTDLASGVFGQSVAGGGYAVIDKSTATSS